MVVSVTIIAQPSLPTLLKSDTQEFPENYSSWVNNPDYKKDELLAGKYYRFVQFYQVPSAHEIEQLQQAGINLLDYIPSYTFVAAISTSLDRESIKDL